MKWEVREYEERPGSFYIATPDGGRWVIDDVRLAREACERLNAVQLGAVAKLEQLVLDGVEAFRLTRDYVGEEALPAMPGWSWFDWCERARAEAHPCPAGDGCALNKGAVHCKHCGRNWPPDETWDRGRLLRIERAAREAHDRDRITAALCAALAEEPRGSEAVT